MDTSTFRTNLKTLLDADATLSAAGVVVYKYPPGDTGLRTNAPVIGFNEIASVGVEDGSLLASSTSDQTYSIQGGVFVKATGESDTAWAAAEATANTLIERIRVVCIENERLSGIATQTRLVAWNLEPTADNVFTGDFTILVRVVA